MRRADGTGGWTRSGLALLVALVPLLLAADCGEDCTVAGLPQPMTEARARELAPSVSTGLALSTTHVRGDCRPRASTDPAPTDACGRVHDLACLRTRAAMRVFLVPTGVSVPRSSSCSAGSDVAALAPLAVLDASTSEAGELVAAVPAGLYVLFISADDRCAVCGLASSDAGCVAEVPRGHLLVRDVVLDEAAH